MSVCVRREAACANAIAVCTKSPCKARGFWLTARSKNNADNELSERRRASTSKSLAQNKKDFLLFTYFVGHHKHTYKGAYRLVVLQLNSKVV